MHWRHVWLVAVILTASAYFGGAALAWLLLHVWFLCRSYPSIAVNVSTAVVNLFCLAYYALKLVHEARETREDIKALHAWIHGEKDRLARALGTKGTP